LTGLWWGGILGVFWRCSRRFEGLYYMNDFFESKLRNIVDEMENEGVDAFSIFKKMLNHLAFQTWVQSGKNPQLYDWFKDSSTTIGLHIESVLSSNCCGVFAKPKNKSKSFDLMLSEELVNEKGLVGNRLEVKVARATHKSSNAEYWERAMMRSEGRFPGKFLQVKKSEADYGLFFIIYADVIDVYWMPYSFIGSRVKLHKQHLGHLTEGQVGISDAFENLCYIGSIDGFSDLNLFNFALEK
jgi:hypothetical protein